MFDATRPVSCPHCPYSTSRKNDLEKHLLLRRCTGFQFHRGTAKAAGPKRCRSQTPLAGSAPSEQKIQLTSLSVIPAFPILHSDAAAEGTIDWVDMFLNYEASMFQ